MPRRADKTRPRFRDDGIEKVVVKPKRGETNYVVAFEQKGGTPRVPPAANGLRIWRNEVGVLSKGKLYLVTGDICEMLREVS